MPQIGGTRPPHQQEGNDGIQAFRKHALHVEHKFVVVGVAIILSRRNTVHPIQKKPWEMNANRGKVRMLWVRTRLV